VEDGYRIAMRWLDTESPPSAIFAFNNFMCMGALSALHERGFKVPEDMAIVSFDDVEFGHLLRPCLTALYYSYQQIGEEAMQLALDSIKLDAGEKIHRFVRLPVRLIVRESCGCHFNPM
jgi:DNA-binding LacI/PurR family transcriptional regulator